MAKTRVHGVWSSSIPSDISTIWLHGVRLFQGLEIRSTDSKAACWKLKQLSSRIIWINGHPTFNRESLYWVFVNLLLPYEKWKQSEFRAQHTPPWHHLRSPTRLAGCADTGLLQWNKGTKKSAVHLRDGHFTNATWFWVGIVLERIFRHECYKKFCSATLIQIFLKVESALR